jgi:predicted nucleic acid-binding protein
MIILDTNVLSELMRPRPLASVVEWLGCHPVSDLFITTITQAEVLFGLELLPRRRRTALVETAEAMFEEDFAERILPFDSAAARVFPRIAAARRALGRPMAQSDAQIAAIARSRDAFLATRNTRDFEHCELTVLNPWRAT